MTADPDRLAELPGVVRAAAGPFGYFHALATDTLKVLRKVQFTGHSDTARPRRCLVLSGLALVCKML